MIKITDFIDHDDIDTFSAGKNQRPCQLAEQEPGNY